MQTLFDIFTWDCNVAMQYEIAVMLCALFVSAAVCRDRKKLTVSWILIFTFFIYLHRILLPFLISGAYLLLLSGIIAAFIRLDISAFFLPAKKLREKAAVYTSPGVLPFTAVILTVLLIQLCRINICIDYDSLRYGLRSDVLLTDGMGAAGFFANTGLVNSVYVYPKGFELLTRPLYFGGTFGIVLCVNVWVLIAVLLAVGETARLCADSDTAEVFAAMTAAVMPGITNMAITAKSDLITLLCQLAFIYCVMRYTGGVSGGSGETLQEKAALPGIGTGALILSYAFKPTALVFSSFIGLAAMIYFAVRRIRIRNSAAGIRALALPAVFTGIVTARTWIITGQPFSGVFSGVFEKLGMRLHYPFRSQSFLDTGEAVSFAEKLRSFLVRLAGFLFCPVGEDMKHVLMAWGGLAFVMMLAVLLFFMRGTGERMEELSRLSRVESSGCGFDREAWRFLVFVWAAAGVISLISLAMLYQVDGNYFMLVYSLTAAAGTTVFFTGAQFEQSGLGRNFKKVLSGGGGIPLVLLCTVMIYFTAFTGWCGPIGFTPADPVNRGYYSHEEEYRQDFGLWNSYARVLAMAYDPDCYKVRGRVESWVDVDGSGGNVYLTDTKFNIFKEYLDFAGIEYIFADINYLNDGFNSRRARAKELFVWLLEDGSFEELVRIPGSDHLIAARLDSSRCARNWEIPLTAEQASRAEEQKKWFDEIAQ